MDLYCEKRQLTANLLLFGRIVNLIDFIKLQSLLYQLKSGPSFFIYIINYGEFQITFFYI